MCAVEEPRRLLAGWVGDSLATSGPLGGLQPFDECCWEVLFEDLSGAQGQEFLGEVDGESRVLILVAAGEACTT